MKSLATEKSRMGNKEAFTDENLKEQLHKENPHLKIKSAESPFTQKNFLMTVVVIETEGKDVPDQVSIYRSQQKPE